MVLKLHGSPTSYSQPTIRVLHILKEKNIPFEFVAIDMRKGQHKSPEHLEKQPFGQLPYIDDEGFILYETRAICRYIALKYRDQGASLIPDVNDLKATALFEQAASIEQSNFEPYALGIVMEKLYSELMGKKPNEQIIADYITKLGAKLDGYEAILSKQKYLAGETVTLADLFHLGMGTVVTDTIGLQLLLDEEKRPNVVRWWKDISSRPAWLAVKNGFENSK